MPVCIKHWVGIPFYRRGNPTAFPWSSVTFLSPVLLTFPDTMLCNKYLNRTSTIFFHMAMICSRSGRVLCVLCTYIVDRHVYVVGEDLECTHGSVKAVSVNRAYLKDKLYLSLGAPIYSWYHHWVKMADLLAL